MPYSFEPGKIYRMPTHFGPSTGPRQGTVQFHRATWEDMPTQFNIVNALAELPIKEYRSASVTKSVGSKDLSDQRRLY